MRRVHAQLSQRFQAHERRRDGAAQEVAVQLTAMHRRRLSSLGVVTQRRMHAQCLQRRQAAQAERERADEPVARELPALM